MDFALKAVDEAGNSATSDNAGAFYSFETGKNVTPTYTTTDPAVSIPDNDPAGAEQTIFISDDETILDLNVQVFVTHTYDGDLGVTFVGVNHQDTPTNALGFLDELGRSAQPLYVEDVGSRLALEFGILGLPETFFIDRDGTIVGKVTGPVSYPLVADTIEAIRMFAELEGILLDPVSIVEIETRDSLRHRGQGDPRRNTARPR